MTIPVTVITGFLGAGKTTVLQYVLRGDHGKKILVIQNEFSDEMGIESPQLVDENGDVIPDMYELPNGCMCCSVRDSLIGTLEAVLSATPGRFDHVVVETSGVANPERVIGLFWVDSELGSQIHLDGVIAVADALNIRRYLELTEEQIQRITAAICGAKSSDSRPADVRLSDTRPVDNDIDLMANLESFKTSQHSRCDELTPSTQLTPLAIEAIKQIACADVILLNKCDLVAPDFPTPASSDSIETTLRMINPSAPILRCERGRVPLEKLLDLNAFNVANVTGWFSNLGALYATPDPHTCLNGIVEASCHQCPQTGSCDHRLSFPNPPVPRSSPPAVNCLISFSISFTLSITDLPLNSFTDSVELSQSLSRHPWICTHPIWSDTQANAAIGSLVWDANCGDIYRYKGIFLVNDGKCQHDRSTVRLVALQGVGEVFEIQPVEVTKSCVNRLLKIGGMKRNENGGFEFINKFLFVGRELQIETMKKCLLDHYF